MRYNVQGANRSNLSLIKRITKGKCIMKKILSLVLALLMLASVMVACGKTGDSVKVINIKLTEEEYAFAVQKGDTELLGKLNAFMTKIKGNGQFDEIINKYH